MRSKKLGTLLTVVFFVASGFSQTAPTEKNQNPTIVTNVDEVTLDLVVHDKKNKPVLDLKPDDITVTDNGAAVKLSDLRLVTAQAGNDHLITLLFDPLDPSAATNAREVAHKILKLIPASGFSLSVMTVGGRLHMLQQFTPDLEAVGRAVNAATAVDSSEKDSSDIALPEKELIARAQTGSALSGTTVSANERTVAQMMLASLQESQRLVQEQHSRST